MERIDYSKAASSCRSLRALPPEVAASWDAAIADLGIDRVGRVLDVGAGPGLFCGQLHDWFGAPITAVEPSAAMRREAQASELPAGCTYVAAAGEQLPLRSDSHDLAWLSTVVHQLDDVAQTARELWRVIAPGGSVLLRGLFGDMEPAGLLARFPGAEQAVGWFPRTDSVVDAFTRAGFSLAARTDVTERRSRTVPEWTSLLEASRSSDSLLRQFSDSQFRAGLMAITGDSADPSAAVPSDLVLRLIHLGATHDPRAIR
jgi:2-polyprenyl-3-methyl-5-hydroxy-6-metoxy-1,4-benzoquinol methylase